LHKNSSSSVVNSPLTDNYANPRFKPATVGQIDPETIPSIVVGIDLGKTFTIGACGKGIDINGDDGKERKRLLSIKKKALNEPSRLFASWLEKKKENTRRLYELEQESTQKQESESILAYWSRYFNRYKQLSAFYNSKSVQKKSWGRNKAQRGEYDRAVCALLKMVDGKYHKKYDGSNPPMFVLGDAKFGSDSSLHTSFESYFISKIAPLGYRIVTVNEYYTSQMCPVTKTRVTDISMRIKKSKDGVYYHRDVMAAENMVNAALGIMKTGKRPEYLTKIEEVKSKEPGGKRKVSS
jgi:transposase